MIFRFVTVLIVQAKFQYLMEKSAQLVHNLLITIQPQNNVSIVKMVKYIMLNQKYVNAEEISQYGQELNV